MKRIAFIVLFLVLSAGVAWGGWTQPSVGGSSGSSAGACQTASSLGFHLNGTDETARLNSTLLSFYNAGGGCLAIDCGKTLRADGQIAMPNSGSYPFSQPPYRITSFCGSSGNYSEPTDCQPNGAACGGHNDVGNIIGGARLDLRYNGSGITALQGGPKIFTGGAGQLEIDHLAIVDGGTDCATFIMSTLSPLKIHDDTFVGYRPSGGDTGCNDVIALGGQLAWGPATGTVPNSPANYANTDAYSA